MELYCIHVIISHNTREIATLDTYYSRNTLRSVNNVLYPPPPPSSKLCDMFFMYKN
jgi:hypothetical protein